MKSHLTQLSYEIELMPGEKLTLPESLVNTVGEGRWQITIQPLPTNGGSLYIRDHSAFLNSYVPSDEGLYDDDPTGCDLGCQHPFYRRQCVQKASRTRSS